MGSFCKKINQTPSTSIFSDCVAAVLISIGRSNDAILTALRVFSHYQSQFPEWARVNQVYFRSTRLWNATDIWQLVERKGYSTALLYHFEFRKVEKIIQTRGDERTKKRWEKLKSFKETCHSSSCLLYINVIICPVLLPNDVKRP